MKHPSENQSQEVIAGLVERVTYHNLKNGFCVLRAKARGHRDVVTVVGHAPTIAAGEWITASGEWVSTAVELSLRARQLTDYWSKANNDFWLLDMSERVLSRAQATPGLSSISPAVISPG
jgi:hypothetical protein